MLESKRTRRRALLVEDEPLQGEGVDSLLQRCGVEVVEQCRDSASALAFLERDHDFDLVLVDKSIPEETGQHPQEGIGPSLLLDIHRKYPEIKFLVLYTALESPNVGDIQRVYEAGASALAFPPGTRGPQEDFVKMLDVVTMGAQVLSPLFKALGPAAIDPARRCPLDPVEYYCARLISENRGKEGAAVKWGPGITVNVIDEILDDIYEKLSRHIEAFAERPRDKKPVALALWYYDTATKLYGAASPVPYESRAQRWKKWRPWVLDDEGC